MREIKFRFFRTKTKEMVYGFPHCSTTYVLDKWENEKHVSDLMQYTGLKDKNGKEIYEGDVVRRTYKSGNHFVGEVIFEDATHFMRNDEEYSFLANQYDGEGLEVVGNIYENHELLEAEE